MTKATIYHNPRCSKSRQALALLEDKLDSVEVREYLKTGFELSELEQIIAIFDGEVSELIRTNEDLYKSAPFDILNSSEVMQGLVKNPKILQRPVVIYKNKAIVARPPEKIEGLL